MDVCVASKNFSRNGPRNCRSLGFPGFPVELGGVGELHAPFLTERRTRGPVLCGVSVNPGSLGMTKGTDALPLSIVVLLTNDTANPLWVQGPEGRPAKRQPSPEGLGINAEEGPSAVGAALNRSSAVQKI